MTLIFPGFTPTLPPEAGYVLAYGHCRLGLGWRRGRSAVRRGVFGAGPRGALPVSLCTTPHWPCPMLRL